MRSIGRGSASSVSTSYPQWRGARPGEAQAGGSPAGTARGISGNGGICMHVRTAWPGARPGLLCVLDPLLK